MDDADTAARLRALGVPEANIQLHLYRGLTKEQFEKGQLERARKVLGQSDEPEQHEKVLELHKRGLTAYQIAVKVGMKKAAVYKIIRPKPVSSSLGRKLPGKVDLIDVAASAWRLRDEGVEDEEIARRLNKKLHKVKKDVPPPPPAKRRAQRVRLVARVLNKRVRFILPVPKND